MTENQVTSTEAPSTIDESLGQNTFQKESDELMADNHFNETSVFGGFNRAPLDNNEPTPDENPEVVPQENQDSEEKPNDTVRYEYWQSEADKARNELNDIKAQLEKVEQSQNNQAQTSDQEESKDIFPPPPSKPSKPSNFSRDEAYADPHSESAKYLDSVDNWRDDMNEYNRLHTEYNVAVLAEQQQEFQKRQQDILREKAEQEKYQQGMNQMQNHLTNTYQASPEEIAKFVEVMDKPEAITVDNLFQLFRMQNGATPTQGTEPIVSAESNTSQDESFDQMKRAQQVPSPMGVLPSSNMNTAVSGEDSIMDSMINDYKKRNPF